jgi:TatD DNase family protein
MIGTENDFLNIHTHFKPKLSNEFAIRNAYLNVSGEQINNLPYPVSCGLHPWHIHKMSLNACGDRLIELASNPKVLAIGEIGLDKAIDTPLKQQLSYFDAQFNVARAYQKPIIIHAVRTYQDFIPFLKKTKVPFIFHGFNGNVQQAKELLKYNCKLSFGKNCIEPKIKEVIQYIPNDAFLLETDSASKLTISDVYTQVADIKQMDLDELKSLVFHTFASIIKPID